MLKQPWLVSSRLHKSLTLVWPPTHPCRNPIPPRLLPTPFAVLVMLTPKADLHANLALPITPPLPRPHPLPPRCKLPLTLTLSVPTLLPHALHQLRLAPSSLAPTLPLWCAGGRFLLWGTSWRRLMRHPPRNALLRAETLSGPQRQPRQPGINGLIRCCATVPAKHVCVHTSLDVRLYS